MIFKLARRHAWLEEQYYDLGNSDTVMFAVREVGGVHYSSYVRYNALAIALFIPHTLNT